MAYACPTPNLLLFSPLFQLNLFSGLILAENHMACDIMGAGSRAKGKDRAEESDWPARSPRGDVSRQACREAGGGAAGWKCFFFVLFFIFYSHLDNQGKNGGGWACGLCMNCFGDLSCAVIENVCPQLSVTFSHCPIYYEQNVLRGKISLAQQLGHPSYLIKKALYILYIKPFPMLHSEMGRIYLQYFVASCWRPIYNTG